MNSCKRLATTSSTSPRSVRHIGHVGPVCRHNFMHDKHITCEHRVLKGSATKLKHIGQLYSSMSDACLLLPSIFPIY